MVFSISRRGMLAGAASLPAASALPTTASAEGAAPVMSLTRSFQLGEMKVTTLLDTTLPRDGAQSIFGGNVSAEEFAAVSAENFISPEVAQFFFTPTLVEVGSQKVLFDSGLGRGGIQTALAQIGLVPADIDVVVITHMHPDHIGGLRTEDAETFANARYVIPSAEYDFWAAMEPGNRVGDLMASNVKPLAEKATFIGDGDSVVSGITALSASGHTPGHTAYVLDSGNRQLLLTADLANHYVWSFAHPNWEVRFDMDKAQAAASRHRVLGMLAADRVPMIGYHMPFPAAGFVETRGDGYRFVPVSYQMMG